MIAWPKILGGALVLAAVTWTVLELRAGGARSVTNAIERQNNAAAHSAGDARSSYDLCIARGGVWKFGAGKCRRAPEGGRH
ncbi:hypothetical protein [Ensifer sp. LC163]|uniref:hypothetical protein n=1 Tax=Ensifer sp. LC163 TaxID=1120652 RepID=UPI001AD84BB1|nr:hypothetical protein [Ensifer sp. LC163]